MILDCHIHILADEPCQPEAFRERLREAGVDGGVVISAQPRGYRALPAARDAEERLENLFAWTQQEKLLFPFYWIDPTEDDALDQVKLAVARGVVGFKIICYSFYPWDERNLAVCRAIAAAGKPILFHSGILWNGHDSARFNRPGGFEAMIEIPGLRFALAHISWPWCDELIAVYGKFLNARSRRQDLTVEMFVDTTPGTPRVYRREAITRLFTVYDVKRNVLAGSDCRTGNYHATWSREWIARDNAIFDEIGVEAETRKGVFGGNLLRFVGLDTAPIEHAIPRPAED